MNVVIIGWEYTERVSRGRHTEIYRGVTQKQV